VTEVNTSPETIEDKASESAAAGAPDPGRARKAAATKRVAAARSSTGVSARAQSSGGQSSGGRGSSGRGSGGKGSGGQGSGGQDSGGRGAGGSSRSGGGSAGRGGSSAAGGSPPSSNGNGFRPGRSGNPCDQTFPIFTVEGSSLRPTLPDDQTPNVTNVLRDTLGWRPVPGDAKAFSAALAASFTLRDVEGHVETTYVPRGFAMQADLGSVTGGQASLYARARSGLTHILQLLDGLTPLQPAFDQENNAATRILVRNEIGRIVEEFGLPGGPRQALVDASFAVLLGTDTDILTRPKVPDLVEGQLGELRERFGLTAENVNTVEDERIRTSFWTLADEIQDLGRAWDSFKTVQGDGTVGFLGTDFVLISRLMEAASEQVDEFEEVLDSVLVGAAERQTVILDGTGLTLDGLLRWTRRFLREDGRNYLTDSGRIGLEKAFEPTAVRLVDTYRRTLIEPLDLDDDDLALLTTPSPVAFLPDGLSAARCKVALLSLFGLLEQITVIADQVSTALVVGDVLLVRRDDLSETVGQIEVSVRIENPATAVVPPLELTLRSTTDPDKVVRSDIATISINDRLSSTFRFAIATADDQRNEKLTALEIDERRHVPATKIPLVVVDLDTTTRVFDSPTKDWVSADLTPIPGTDEPEWPWESDEDLL
jgi:hypothetical protein